MGRKRIRKPNKRQRAFADNFIRNGGNAYQAAISAGYSKVYAKSRAYKLSESVVIRHYIRECKNAAVKRYSREKISNEDVMENMMRIAAGHNRKDHYKVTDNIHPEESSDKTVDAPPPTRDQVSAIDLYLKSTGQEHANSREFENAQIKGVKAKAYINEQDAKEIKRQNEEKHKKRQVPVFQYLHDAIVNAHKKAISEKSKKNSENSEKHDKSDENPSNS